MFSTVAHRGDHYSRPSVRYPKWCNPTQEGKISMTERRYREEIDRFEAKDDDGKIFTVVEYQHMIEVTPISGPTSIAKGTKELFLTNGHSVEYIDDETFKVIETGKIIRRVR